MARHSPSAASHFTGRVVPFGALARAVGHAALIDVGFNGGEISEGVIRISATVALSV